MGVLPSVQRLDALTPCNATPGGKWGQLNDRTVCNGTRGIPAQGAHLLFRFAARTRRPAQTIYDPFLLVTARC